MVMYITSVIAHVDHEKSTFIDSLIYGAGIISASSTGNARTDIRAGEKECGIILKSTAVRMYFEFPKDELTDLKQAYDLIDSTLRFFIQK